MSTDHRRAIEYMDQLLWDESQYRLIEHLIPEFGDLPPTVLGNSLTTSKVIAQRWGLVAVFLENKATLYNPSPDTCQRNIETFISTVTLPARFFGSPHITHAHLAQRKAPSADAE